MATIIYETYVNEIKRFKDKLRKQGELCEQQALEEERLAEEARLKAEQEAILEAERLAKKKARAKNKNMKMAKKQENYLGMNSPKKFKKERELRENAVNMRKFLSTRPKVETSVKRDKSAGYTSFEASRKKSQKALTGNSMAKLQDTAASKNGVSPRNVISFSLLDEADNNLTKVSVGKFSEQTGSAKRALKVVLQVKNEQKLTNTNSFDNSENEGIMGSQPTSIKSKTITVDSGDVKKFSVKDQNVSLRSKSKDIHN